MGISRSENTPREHMAGIGTPSKETELSGQVCDNLSAPHIFLDRIITQSPYPMWISDDAGTLIMLNAACKNLLKISEEDVVGKYNILNDNIVHEQGFMPLVRSVFDAGETVRFELRYDSRQLRQLELSAHADVVLDVTIFPVRDSEERIRHAVIQHIDITQRKKIEEELRRAQTDLEKRVAERTVELTVSNRRLSNEIAVRNEIEQQLRESEERYRLLVEHSPEAIFIYDDGKFTFANERGCSLLGAGGPEELKGRSVLDFIHPEYREAARRRISAAVGMETNPLMEQVLVRLDGTVVPVEVASAPYICNGRRSTQVFAYDISDRKKLQDEFIKNQKLESVGVLAGGIAHDFNNILTSILGNISLARNQAGHSERVEQLLAAAESATVKAKALTQQLLTFSKGGEPVKKTVVIGSLLKEAAEFASHGSPVRCRFAVADDLWPVEADEGQLGQVIHNLVLNAVQTMPDGGVVWISAENIDAAEGKKLVKISVTDTGTGIPRENLQKIFDPYFTTKQYGTGLGLTSCHWIVKKHDGSLSVISEVGKGSTFTIDLPAAEQGSEVEHDASASNVTPGKGTVLVMDDDISIREVAQLMLEELGYTSECAADGSEAVTLYRSRKREGTPFQAVIMDLTVAGGLGGKEAIKLLLEFDPDVKAIVSSGYSTDPVVANYREHGFCAVLGKPYRLEEIANLLRHIIV